MAMAEMATLMGDNETKSKYDEITMKAKIVYDREVWDDKAGYFKYDSNNSGHSNSIMADMLAGHWYSLACGLEPGVVDSERAVRCLQKIYQYNVVAFSSIHDTNSSKESGKFLKGAVNGTKPIDLVGIPPKSITVNNLVDNSCLQSREVWTGTTYGLAACMIHEGKRASRLSSKSSHNSINISRELMLSAYTTAQGIHDAGWQRYGYWYSTPEAWEASGNYRSLGYMRPLSIWAMQYAREFDQ